MSKETEVNNNNSFFLKKLKTVINTDGGHTMVMFNDGDVIDSKYRVLHKISQSSGEADIYKVQDIRNHNVIKVLKLFRRKNAIKSGVIDRLLDLRSPYVAEFSDSGSVDGHTYIVIPFYGKGSLGAFISQGVKFTAEEIRTLILPSVLEGLKAIHDAGILHKDLKPDNMMIADDESHIVLIDFGISSVADGSTIVVTQTGKSPFYSAPETSTGIFWTGSDYYSLGISLYELYTGFTPYQNAGIENIALYAQTQRIPFPDDFDADLKDLIEGLTYKDISNRNDGDNPNRRWEYPEVTAWLRGEKPPVPGRNTAPGNDKAIVPYVFKQQKYFSHPEIATALLTNWQDGKKEVFRGFLGRYFETTEDTKALALCHEAERLFNRSGSNSDVIFFKLMYSLAPEIKEFYWQNNSFSNVEELAKKVKMMLATEQNITIPVQTLLRDGILEKYAECVSEGKIIKAKIKKINLQLAKVPELEKSRFFEKHLAVIFTNTFLDENKILFDNRLFYEEDDIIKYLKRMHDRDLVSFVNYCHDSITDLKNIFWMLSEEGRRKFRDFLPLTHQEKAQTGSSSVFQIDNYFFQNLEEAGVYFAGLRELKNRRTDDKELQTRFLDFHEKYRTYLRNLNLSPQKLKELEKTTGLKSNPYITGEPVVGQRIKFGSGRPGKEILEWTVLKIDRENGRALLLSRDILDYRPFTTENHLFPVKLKNIRRILYIIAFYPLIAVLLSVIVLFAMATLRPHLEYEDLLISLIRFIWLPFRSFVSLFKDDNYTEVRVSFILICAHVIIYLQELKYRIIRRVIDRLIARYEEINVVSWRKSEIRAWLNGSFLKENFTENEIRYIFKSKQTAPGMFNSTTDRIFLLSIDELNRFSRICFGKDTTRRTYRYRSAGVDTCWWLREPAGKRSAPAVSADGEICIDVPFYVKCGVRAAMWIEL